MTASGGFLDIENIEFPHAVGEINSDINSSSSICNDRTIAHKEIKNCSDSQQQESFETVGCTEEKDNHNAIGDNDSLEAMENEAKDNILNEDCYTVTTSHDMEDQLLTGKNYLSMFENISGNGATSPTHHGPYDNTDPKSSPSREGILSDKDNFTDDVDDDEDDDDDDQNDIDDYDDDLGDGYHSNGLDNDGEEDDKKGDNDGNDVAKCDDENDGFDDIDAPAPSPFSDIGEMSGVESAMITDILKETSDTQQQSPILEISDTIISDANKEVCHTKDQIIKKRHSVDDGFEEHELEHVSGYQDESDNIMYPQRSLEPEHSDYKRNKNDETQEQSGDVGGLIADIFGDSDDEEGEFEGFHEEELQKERLKLLSRTDVSETEGLSADDSRKDASYDRDTTIEEESNESDSKTGKLPGPIDEESSDDEQNFEKTEVISDFDLMMQRKKEAMGSRRRKKRDFEIINDNDDIIAAMIRNMRDAAEEDRMLNQTGKAATKKLKMLDSVVSHLHKADLQHTFIDGGVLPVMKEWLSPLPDNSLPHVMIRKHFLRLLSEFPALDTGALKMSGIGRAVMLLYKHPKESRENRNLAGKIVAQWARPIFGVQTNFKDISKEEREERDKFNAAEYKKRRLSSTDESLSTVSQEDKSRPKRPGDKGFIARARVPRPSNRDYIVRPKSDVSFGEFGNVKNPKKSLDRFEKQIRKYKERKKIKSTAERAVSMSLNGSKMAL